MRLRAMLMGPLPPGATGKPLPPLFRMNEPAGTMATDEKPDLEAAKAAGISPAARLLSEHPHQIPGCRINISFTVR